MKFLEYYYCFGWKGVWWFLISQWGSTVKRVHIKQKGYDYPIYFRIGSSDTEVYHQIIAREEYAFDISIRPQWIVDAGANIGLTSVFFSKKFPDATILALEPEASNYALLKQNTKSYPNIIALNKALWKNASEIDIVDTGEGAWSFQTTAHHPVNGKPALRVWSTTIDQLMAEYNIPCIDILKIDIEGSEKEVFENPSKWIERVSAIIIELHDRFRPGCSRHFYRFMDHHPQEGVLGDCVIVAKEGIDAKINSKIAKNQRLALFELNKKSPVAS